MSYDLIDRADGLALSQMANRYGIGVLVAVLAAEADGRGDYGTAKALRAAGVSYCGQHDEAHCVRCRAPLGASQYTPNGADMPTFCSVECYLEGRGMDAKGGPLATVEG